MLGTALYYPYIDIRDRGWLRSAILFWDAVQTIVPSSIQNPYHQPDTQICEKEGYLRPLRCDLHQELLEQLGNRVLKLLESPEWAWAISSGKSLVRWTPSMGPRNRVLSWKRGCSRGPFYHAAKSVACFCCCGCGHVGNALALSIMSTALGPIGPVMPARQTAIGGRSPSAWWGRRAL